MNKEEDKIKELKEHNERLKDLIDQKDKVIAIKETKTNILSLIHI